MSHGPIPSLKWGEMTMEFKLGAAEQARRLLPVIDFRFHRSGNDFVLEHRETRRGAEEMIAKLIHWSIANRFWCCSQR